MRLRLSRRPALRAGVATATAALAARRAEPAVALVRGLGRGRPAPPPDSPPPVASQLRQHPDRHQGDQLDRPDPSGPQERHQRQAAIPVMIKYDYDPLTSYSGTIKGLAATSPSTTGAGPRRRQRGLEGLPREGRARWRRPISAAVKAAAPGTTITGSPQIVYGGVSAIVPGNQIAKILKVPGVVAVQRDAAAPAERRRELEVHRLRPRPTPRSAAKPTAGAGAAARQPRQRCLARAPGLRGPARPPGVRRRGDPVQLRRQPADPGERPVRAATTSSSAAARSSRTYIAQNGDGRPGLPHARVTPRATAPTPPRPRPATSSSNAQTLGPVVP